MQLKERIWGAVYGHAIGDALGVPVEFCPRESLDADPVTEMRGQGTHRQPPGTWSDDTSLMLCLLEVVKPDLNLKKLADRFRAWRRFGHLTPHGQVFDIGISTRRALQRIAAGVAPELAGGAAEEENGNGSLMRILPVAFFPELTAHQMVRLAWRAASPTHRHPRSLLACGLFVLLCRRLLNGDPPSTAYRAVVGEAPTLFAATPCGAELAHFRRFLSGELHLAPRREIQSTGYVVHTLEAAAWCLLTAEDFSTTVLTAVNLGEDTDTTAAVAGGLAGAAYGLGALPERWLAQLARRDRLENVLAAFWRRINL